MKRSTSIKVLLLLVSVATGVARAQVKVLSPTQIANDKKQLPSLSATVAQKSVQNYLKQLKPTDDNANEIASAVRVAEDTRKGSLPTAAFFSYYAVPAISSVMRLPDAYPLDGKFGGDVEIVMARDQYQDASFEVYPFKNLDGVELKLSALKSADGSTFSAENLDLRVVKVWYQNGNGWFSYFADPGLKLVPELLLHDENLIRVDTKEKANYARIKTAKGTKEVWISAPQKLNVGFDPYQDGFVDAKTLQPVSLTAGQFKQFVLTAHATADTKPGIYQGNITVSAKGQKSQIIPVAIKVLSFQLPLPKTNYDINKDFVVSLMGAWPEIDPHNKAFLSTLKDLRAHNILELGPNVDPNTPPDQAALQVKLMKQAGFLTKPIFGGGLPGGGANNRPPLSFDQQMELERLSKWYSDYYKENFGHTDAFIGSGDEQGAAWLLTERPLWRIEHRNGLKSNLAGHIETYFPTSGYMLDVRPTAGSPEESDKANLWKQIGSGYTGFYAGQHNGSENPAFVRRQHGLLGYLSNFDMVDNYQFAYGPWNDRAWDLYKPMVLAYPISDGLVDTLEWEGFRSGIDDIRYATKLRQLADEAIASDDLDRVDAGKKVRQWFAELDGSSVDLNTARLEMIQKIEDLMQLSSK
jgi:hypothetical protein